MRARCMRRICPSPDTGSAEATNGVEAIEKTIELLPDIILIDLALPRMDGEGRDP